jgi:transposase
MDRETTLRAIQLLVTRSDWSWHEADREFEAHKLEVRGDWVYKVLRRAGFVYDRESRRWVRGEP